MYIRENMIDQVERVREHGWKLLDGSFKREEKRGGGGREERWPGLILPTADEDSATILIPFVQKRFTA